MLQCRKSCNRKPSKLTWHTVWPPCACSTPALQHSGRLEVSVSLRMQKRQLFLLQLQHQQQLLSHSWPQITPVCRFAWGGGGRVCSFSHKKIKQELWNIQWSKICSYSWSEYCKCCEKRGALHATGKTLRGNYMKRRAQDSCFVGFSHFYATTKSY